MAETLEDRIRRLEAENDALSRANEDLHWQVDWLKRAERRLLDSKAAYRRLAEDVHADLEAVDSVLARRYVGRFRALSDEFEQKNG